MGNAEAGTNSSTLLPEERSGHVAVRWKHFMYVWGGYNDNERNQFSQCLDPKIIWKYDVNNCKWFKCRMKGSVPSGRLGSCWARIGERLVVFGGCDTREDKNDVCVLHFDSLRWSFPKPSGLSPSERNKSAAIACGNKSIFDRKRSTYTPANTVVGATDLKKSVSPKAFFDAVISDGVVLNGKTGINTLLHIDDQDLYAVIGGEKSEFSGLVVFGGYGPEPIAELHIINGKYDVDLNSFFYNRGWNNHLLAFDITTNQWSALPNQGERPSSRAAHAFTAIGDKAFVFGGRHQHERLNDSYSLCLDTFQWTRISDNDKLSEPRGRSWHTLTAISADQLFLFGGLDTDKNILSDSWIYDTRSSLWIRSIDKNFFRMWHTACHGSYAGQVLLFGGCIDSIFTDSNHSDQVLELNVQPKSLIRVCLETLALHQQPGVDYRDFLPPSLYRKLASLIGEGG